MTTVPIVYPASLPMPQSAPIQSAERRAIAPEGGLYEVRALQRDRLSVQRVIFPAFSPAQMATFWAWYVDDLESGGAWFAATWPLPQGTIPAARRFLAPPHAEFIPSPKDNYWRVTADFEVRGRGEMPVAVISNCTESAEMAEIALTEPIAVALWRTETPAQSVIDAYEDDHPAIINSYVLIETTAGGGDALTGVFFINISVSWNDLVDGAVNVFGSNRNGVWPNTQSFSLTITDIPESGDPECRACAFVNYGGWGGDGTDMHPKGYWSNTDPQACPMTVQGDLLGIPGWYDDGIAGPGVIVGTFLVRAENGSATGVWIG